MQLFNAFYALTCLTGLAVLLRELLQMWENGLHYFRELDNWLEVSILGCTVAYLICVYTDPIVAPHFGAVAVLFAWIEMTFLIGRIPTVGIYVYMIVHVIKMLFVLLAFFCFILVGFAVAFHILLPRQQSFKNPVISAIKVLVMMSGEFEFDDIFVWDVVEGKGSNGTTQIVFLLFLFMVTIVISNLLIAMTVSKTEELFKEAGVIRLKKTVVQVMAIEGTLTHTKRVLSIFPVSIRRALLDMTQLFAYLGHLNEAGKKKLQRKQEGSLSRPAAIVFQYCSINCPRGQFWSNQ